MSINKFSFNGCRRRPAKKNSGLCTGQGLVEFALILPVLLMLIYGVLEVGRVVYMYNAVLTASREAARYGSAGDSDAATPRYQDCDGIRAAAKRMGGLANLQDADIAIRYDSGPGTATVASSCPSGAEITGGRHRIVVTVSSIFQPFSILGNTPAFTLQSTVARTIIVKIEVPAPPP